MNELGLYLKAAREHRGMTIREAEELSGISNAYISQIENGKVQRLSPKIVRKLSRLYHVSYEMLLLKAGHQIPDYGISAEQNAIKATILIVDDDPHDRELIRSFLKKDQSGNYEIHEAEKGEEALAIMAEKAPDCVFLDYRLPDIDGLEVFARMKNIEHMKTASVIIMTGQGSEETVVSAMRMGAENYFIKDAISEETLTRTVQHAIRKKLLLEKIRMSARKGRRTQIGIKSSLIDIGTQIHEAAARIIEKAEHMKDDPDILLIMEKSARLTELIAGGNADTNSK